MQARLLCSYGIRHKVPAGQRATTKAHLLGQGRPRGLWVWVRVLLRCPHHTDALWTAVLLWIIFTMEVLRSSSQLPEERCVYLLFVMEQTQWDKGNVHMSSGHTCCWWPVCWQGRSLQARTSAGHLLWWLVRNLGGDLTFELLLGWRQLWDTGRQRTQDTWPQPELDQISRVVFPISTLKKQRHQCHSRQMLIQPTLRDPSDNLYRLTPTSHSAVFCHPPSRSIMFCLSSLVLFCFFFCSLPACCFSNSWHWFVSLPALRLIWAFQHLLFLLLFFSPSQILLTSVSSTDQAVEGNQLWNPFQTIFSFLERIPKPNLKNVYFN